MFGVLRAASWSVLMCAARFAWCFVRIFVSRNSLERSILPETLGYVSRGAFVREFFVEARDWCVLVRLSCVACVGGVRVVAAAWPAGSSLSRDITGSLRVSRF